MTEPDEPLSPELRDELRRGAGEHPDPSLKLRTIRALRAQGLLSEAPAAGRRGRRTMAMAAAVTAAAVFLAGFWAGSLRGGPLPSATPAATDGLYLLLLREPEGGLGVEGRSEQELTAEYASWARAEARAGRLVRGEKLAADARRIGGAAVPVSSSDSEISGFFLIRAPDLQQATQIARSCPHVRYGGAIEIRPIESD